MKLMYLLSQFLGELYDNIQLWYVCSGEVFITCFACMAFFPLDFHLPSFLNNVKMGIVLASINGNLLSVCFYVATSEVLIKSYEFHKVRT